MAGNGNGFGFERHGWEKRIPFGWRLASVNDMNDNLELINVEIALADNEIIYLLDGGDCHNGRASEDLRRTMYVLLVGQAPSFKIVKREMRVKEIEVSWRFASVQEVSDNLDNVKEIIAEAGLQIVCLSDGFVEASGKLTGEIKNDLSHVLLIETPPNTQTGGSSAANDKDDKGQKGIKMKGDSSAAKNKP
ncbi:hypothetical protein SUGI_0703390 [Cryptomeria japonica]|nr:hypothetical protein SUGI_0703390 [Cryptomeria japonica]